MLFPEAQYCYRCCTWTNTADQWNRHCEGHLAHPSMKCEIWISHYTLIAPGFCPFCISDSKLPAPVRAFQWTNSKQLWDHIDSHTELAEWPDHCPHPLCDTILQSADVFQHHMVDVHGKAVNWSRKPAVAMDSHWRNVQGTVSPASLVGSEKTRQPGRKGLSRKKKAPLPGLYQFNLQSKAGQQA